MLLAFIFKCTLSTTLGIYVFSSDCADLQIPFLEIANEVPYLTLFSGCADLEMTFLNVVAIGV